MLNRVWYQTTNSVARRWQSVDKCGTVEVIQHLHTDTKDGAPCSRIGKMKKNECHLGTSIVDLFPLTSPSSLQTAEIILPITLIPIKQTELQTTRTIE